jgi:hypothetical protein
MKAIQLQGMGLKIIYEHPVDCDWFNYRPVYHEVGRFEIPIPSLTLFPIIYPGFEVGYLLIA